MPGPAPRPAAVWRAIQRTAMSDDKTIGESLWADATAAGHSSSHEGTLVDLVTLKRASLSFFSESLLAGKGVEKPDASDACEQCGKTTDKPWELDHLNPWRPYVAALLSEDQYKISGKKLLVPFELVRALYSDPDNLWYICKTCNSGKSDKVYTDIADLSADLKAPKKARPKRARTRGAGVLTVL